MTPEDLRLLAAIYTGDLRLMTLHPSGRLVPVEGLATTFDADGIVLSGTVKGHPYVCHLRHRDGIPLGLLAVEWHGRRDGVNTLKVSIRVKMSEPVAVVTAGP